MKIFIVLIFALSAFNSFSKPRDWSSKLKNEHARQEVKDLLFKYGKNYKNKKDLLKLKGETLKLSGKAVPVLVRVMKNSKYPDKNRWIATFLLGRIMGKKSAPFISKFLKHPSWIMRMASLKTLLALKQKKYGSYFAKTLKDKSLVVRGQAIENIRKLNIKEFAPNIWVMLYDKNNYYQNKKGLRRANIIKKIITTVGDLKFKKALKPLFKMVSNKKYDDIFGEIDYALAKITGKTSPSGNKKVKRIFWSRASLANIII